MRAFITGSHAYGKPNKDSDVDSVIYTDQLTKDKLIELSDSCKMPCRFGDLNIIFATNEEEYAAWLLGKKSCEALRPLDKKQAFDLHDKARVLFDVKYDHDSGPE